MQEFYSLGHVLTAAAREIIEHPDAVASLQQRIDKMRAHEPGTAGHEKVSHLIPLRVDGTRSTDEFRALSHAKRNTNRLRAFRDAGAGAMKAANDRASLPFFRAMTGITPFHLVEKANRS